MYAHSWFPEPTSSTISEISDGNRKHLRRSLRRKSLAGSEAFTKKSEKDTDVQEIQEYEIKEDELRKNSREIERLIVNQFKKTKPKYFTPATLITAMQTCGRSLENENAKKILAETKGIGTPATQATYPQNT